MRLEAKKCSGGGSEGDGTKSKAPMISRNVDSEVNHILDLVTRDYVLYWFGHLVRLY